MLMLSEAVDPDTEDAALPTKEGVQAWGFTGVGRWVLWAIHTVALEMYVV